MALKMKSIISPTLDSAGRFCVPFAEAAAIAVDQILYSITAAVLGGATTINVASVVGLAIGQTITIADNNNSETRAIATIPTSTTITVAATTNAYTMAANPRISLPAVGKCAAWVTDPFVANQLIHLSWTKDITLVSGTATITSPTPPVVATNGAVLITVGGAGDVYLTLPPGASGTAVSGTAAVTGTPKAMVPGANLITLGGAGNFTLNLVGIPTPSNVVVVTAEKATTAAGAGTFAVCVTADLVAQAVTVLADVD